MKSILLGAACASLIAVVSQTAQAVTLPLEGRLETAPGSGVFQAYYDPNLDITWAADANINSFDTWDNQVAWTSGLTLGGVTGWRLPSADVNGDGTVINCSGGGVTGCADNEMGFLYWEEGVKWTTPAPFSNVQFGYWSGTAFAPNPASAWYLNFNGGGLFEFSKSNNIFAWAVRSGDVSAVPVPAAVWLFGSGLMGLIGIARRKKTA